VRFLLDHDVPDDIEYSLAALGHEVLKLREVLPRTTPDEEIFRLGGERDCILITCNRDDFLAIAGHVPHAGLVVLIRRRTRAQERAALVRLLDNAGESGLCGNINFA
jgi:predicted nuclease of predicted toxin-antitoxin system